MSVCITDYLLKANGAEYEGVSHRYSMKSTFGCEAQLLNYGALIEKLFVPDTNGQLADVMLGLKDLDHYMASGANHGSVVGRSANRIKGAKFKIGDNEYKVPDNDGGNNLHGGNPSYQNVFWDGKVITKEEADQMIADSKIEGISKADSDGVLFTYTSPDGACGFPGNLESSVLYVWLMDRTLLILYKGVSDKDTIFAPTNHSYFNLRGHNSGSVKDLSLMIDADNITVKAESNCPEGEIKPVEGTIFDFRDPDLIEKVLTTDDPQTCNSLGIDQNYCLNNPKTSEKFAFAACLADTVTGRIMEVYTDLPGLQIYAGNHLHFGAPYNEQKGDTPYVQYGGICLEAQMYPNAINVPEFESPVIKAGEVKYHACGYRFNC